MKGFLYYGGEHDILKRKRTMIGEDGKLQAVENLPNNLVIDNQYAKMVSQKANIASCNMLHCIPHCIHQVVKVVNWPVQLFPCLAVSVPSIVADFLTLAIRMTQVRCSVD